MLKKLMKKRKKMIIILSSEDKCRIFNSYNYLSVDNYDEREGEKGTGGSAQADLEELKMEIFFTNPAKTWV